MNDYSNYNEFIKYLESQKDIKYKNFHFKLLKNDKINLIGIRTSKLKKIAKEISKNNYQNFILKNTHKTYEETLIHGLILGYLNMDFNKLEKLLNEFIPNIDNWATCDLTVTNLKIFKQEQENGYKYISKCLKSKNIWKQRVGIVLLNSYYINDEYINIILEIIPNIKTNEYYLQTAIAWLISTCYIKYPDITINILKEKKLDIFIHNKSIQKIIESKRISNKEKEKLKQLKIKTQKIFKKT